MEVLQFIAPTAAAALDQIHKQLGPDAVVLSVRPVPAQGLARLLPGQTRIEVLAGVPDPSTHPTAFPTQLPASESQPRRKGSSQRWQTVAWLEAHGLMPAFADRLQSHVCSIVGTQAPQPLEAEWQAVTKGLCDFWRPVPSMAASLMARPHVFIGPAGSGKTTALCKWLTLATLMEERVARVFRLDGASANTADYLTIHCEMLGVPVERFWKAPANRAEMLFIDLPGVDAREPQSIHHAREQIAALPDPHVHLVLNAAYEPATLLAQCEAFAPLQPHDLILTHLDEEPRRMKLWNFAFGSQLPIRYLSSGQKIPGEFHSASPDRLLTVE
ncbi:MAG TPA: hypothetical protein VEH04_08695 [Verrucomicrobiae bacterium]|nr:hypothetical protein [Verrucomicrobiae bacterium]